MIKKLLYFGTSMKPLFREGDVLEVVPYCGLEIRQGDVVAFAHPEKTEKFIHRVVAVKPWGIFTKGDNLAAMEDWILKPGDILGKVKVKNGSFGWEDYSSGEKCPACLTGPSGVPSGFSRTKQACPSSSLPNPPITP